MKKRPHILLLSGRYFPKIHRGIAKYCRESGWHLNAEFAQIGATPHGWEGDGVILACTWSQEVQKFIETVGCPIVFIGKAERYQIKLPSVSEDNRVISRLAFEHFHQRHFSNYAWYSRRDRFINERLVLYKEFVEEAGGTCTCLPAPSELNWKQRQLWLAEQLKKLPKPIAIFTEMDEVALEVVEACIDAGIMVPEEVAVLGVRNDELVCECSPIPLSSIENDHDQLGYEAARLMDFCINNPDSELVHRYIYPEKVITRQSSDVLAISHPDVVKALGYIRENYAHQLSIDDIVRSTKLSKAGLYKAFNEHIRRTPWQELTRVRLEKAQELLKDSALKINEVARLCGFGDYHSLYFTFKREVGMTPKQFRKKAGS